MGCPASVKLNHDLVFSIVLHDLDMAVLTDADKPPVFRVYRDLEHKPIHIGEMHRLDKPGATGLYATLLHCHEKHGFKTGNYTVFIQASVQGDASGITYNFIVRE